MAKKGEKKYFDIHAPVFYPAAIIVLATILVSFFYSESLVESFAFFQEKTSEYAGWFFILSILLRIFYGFPSIF